MNRTEFLHVAHLAAAVEPAAVPEFLASLESDDQTGNPSGFAGMILALYSKFPDATYPDLWAANVPLTLLQNARELDTAGSLNGSDVSLAEWAVSGELGRLAELIRRALNRDGSAGSDQVSMDAIALIAEAAETDSAFPPALVAANFSLGLMRFGSFPPGSVSLPLPGPGARVGSGISRTARSAPAHTSAVPGAAGVSGGPVPARRAVPIRTVLPGGAGNGVVADHQTGKLHVAGVVLSISDGVKLRDSITTAVTDLLRPAEGFSWLDDTMDPQSRAVLIDLDNVRAAGLPEASGGFLHGEVIQIPARGPDENGNAGKYLGRVYNRAGGFNEFATDTDDMNAAKFAVAERVRVDLSNQ